MRIRRQVTIAELFVVIALGFILVSLVMPVRTPSAGPLDHAAMNGNVSEARRLIDSGHVDVNRHGNMNRTALHYAALRGREDVARLLLAKGADPNARDYSRRTPLHYATALDRDHTSPCRQRSGYQR
jgi:ankyrin repeat protein